MQGTSVLPAAKKGGGVLPTVMSGYPAGVKSPVMLLDANERPPIMGRALGTAAALPAASLFRKG